MPPSRSGTASRPPSFDALDEAFTRGRGATLLPVLFPQGPLADNALRAAHGVAAMLSVAGQHTTVADIVAVWPCLEVNIPTTAIAALDGMELQVANACASWALPAIGAHDILRVAYDATCERDDDLAYRCEASALVDRTLARHGRDPGEPGYVAERAALVDRLLADYHRDVIARIRGMITDLDEVIVPSRRDALPSDVVSLSTAGAHLRALRPHTDVLDACARAIPALLLRARRRPRARHAGVAPRLP